MSGLQSRSEEHNGVDVREQGSALRVATNTPHLVSLGTGRLSTAVTLHPIKQGRVTIGSDPTCDIHVLGTGVANIHCRVENSHGAVTLYPLGGTTLVDAVPIDKPVRLSQGCMLTIGRSNYLRFNHPEEAKLMKSVLPTTHLSMAPTQYTPNEAYVQPGHQNDSNQQRYQNPNNQSFNQSNQSDIDVNQSTKLKPKPPVPKKPQLLELQEIESEKPKISSIMAKVSKFEYYARNQQKNQQVKSQFYTNDYEISPKVFTSNSLTMNMPAKDVLGTKLPSNKQSIQNNKESIITLSENNSTIDSKGSYVNVSIRNRTKIDDIVRNFDDKKPLQKKVNNETRDYGYGKINNQDLPKTLYKSLDDANECGNVKMSNVKMPGLPSPCFDREPQYSPIYSNYNPIDRRFDAECVREKAYQERIKEEEDQHSENARLEEILNMCAEYERQISSGTPNTPTEKRSHNKIITNGSLPRSVVVNNPNFVQTSEGYYKFDTNNTRNKAQNRPSPQRHVSSYENYDPNQIYTQTQGNIDDIGIPVFDEPNKSLSSPILIRRVIEQKTYQISPNNSPYDKGLKPKSPSTQSPRSRIKTTFAHKNVSSPQYFIFPTPPPKDDNIKPNFTITKDSNENKPNLNSNKDQITIESPKALSPIEIISLTPECAETKENGLNYNGIEKQLSLEEEIPMIDDTDISDDIVNRTAKVIEPLIEDNKVESPTEIVKNKSFDDVRKELMADIPELDEFEKDLQRNRAITKDTKKKIEEEDSSNESMVLDVNLGELRVKYDNLKEERKKFLIEISEYKSKMTEIRSQEDDILRDLEMEKALIKGEYDSEIAILNIEQKKRTKLSERVREIEDEIKSFRVRQEARQSEMKSRVDVATSKVERIQKDLEQGTSTDDELQNARDVLDNECKLFEDLEFQHLEEESELLAAREDKQNELATLNKKIESQKQRILTLKSEASNNLTSALDETKILQSEYVKLLNKVEGITEKIQIIEKELKPLVLKLNDLERTQSPDSAFYTDQTRAKSGDYGYSPQNSDSDNELTKLDNYESHAKFLSEKFNSIDQMSQSMTVDIERRDIIDLIDDSNYKSDSSPSKTLIGKKGFWERGFDSLKRKKKTKPVDNKIDLMSMSLNENLIFNADVIETEPSFDRFGSLRLSKSKKDKNGISKSTTSKIPTFSSFSKIIKKTNKESNQDSNESPNKNRYTKNIKNATDSNNKYSKKTNEFETINQLNQSVDSPNKTKIGSDSINQFHQTVDSSIKTKISHSKSKSFDQDSVVEPKSYYRKSCGDEPNLNMSVASDVPLSKITDSGKIPSQDDIDRISKVTTNAPLFTSDTNMNSLGKKTFDSLMEIEKKRLAMLEEQGCQVIENEREKISELKRRVQNETKKLWDQKYKQDMSKSFDSADLTCQSFVSDYDSFTQMNERIGYRANELEDSSLIGDSLNTTSSNGFEDNSGLMSSSSIEELQVRDSRAESTDGKLSDDSRPLSHVSDLSRDNILSPDSCVRRCRRGVAPFGLSQRPLTRYLPQDNPHLDLRTHLATAGHQVELCPHVTVTMTSCRGYLHKLGAKFHTWSKRWFVFDRDTKTFVYYWDKSEKKPRGGAYFQVIEQVYLDHANLSRSASPLSTFVVSTRQRKYYLQAASGGAARIWIDVVTTGAQGHQDYADCATECGL